jgi:hypothetical protein
MFHINQPLMPDYTTNLSWYSKIFSYVNKNCHQILDIFKRYFTMYIVFTIQLQISLFEINKDCKFIQLRILLQCPGII